MYDIISKELVLRSVKSEETDQHGQTTNLTGFTVCIKLVSHWDATILRLVGDKGLRYKRDFLPLRSHWTL